MCGVGFSPRCLHGAESRRFWLSDQSMGLAINVCHAWTTTECEWHTKGHGNALTLD